MVCVGEGVEVEAQFSRAIRVAKAEHAARAAIARLQRPARARPREPRPVAAAPTRLGDEVVVVDDPPEVFLHLSRLPLDFEQPIRSVLHINIAVEDHDRLAGPAHQPLDVVLGIARRSVRVVEGALEHHYIPSPRAAKQVEVLQDEDPIAVVDGRGGGIVVGVAGVSGLDRRAAVRAVDRAGFPGLPSRTTDLPSSVWA